VVLDADYSSFLRIIMTFDSLLICVCLLTTTINPAKTDEPIEILLEGR